MFKLCLFEIVQEINFKFYIVQVLAQATEILFRRIDSMAATAFDRFVWWFAYHLSNFQFRWSWEDWDSCLQRDPEHPRPKFIREVLLKALRYSTQAIFF